MEEGTNNSNGFVLSKAIDLALMTSKQERDEAFLKSMPPGYRFKPRDDELVNYYLKRKVYHKPLPPNRIREVHLYNYDPETLTEESNKSSDGAVNEWFFFTPRHRKYPNGKRPGRGAGNGYWKATGADKHIKYKGDLVGFKKTLVFYKGKPPKGDKTSWIMHEYVLSNPPAIQRAGADDMRLDDWVLCRVYKKQYAKSKLEIPRQSTDQKQEEDEDAIPAQTETHKQEFGIPPPQSDQQFQVLDFNVLPLAQQTCPMPFLNNAYDNSTFGGLPQFPESVDSLLQYDSTIFSQLFEPDYGNPILTAAPISSIPPPGQFHFIGDGNFNIHEQQQQFSGAPCNFEFSPDDQFLLKSDFGLPNIFRDL
ncbi:NAC transcription factor 29-like [Durio zibethinus]|uniref:NAC transcription factor 29-like n=1 Tax=Durio zibethinus TaxID=66656 RepID=A0A6P6AHI2_DURZI|nr:NAC transcription factor 29-like [Durio zibethinus]